MSGQPVVAAMLAEVLHGPVVPGAACHGVAPEWDREIVGETLTDRHARQMCARRVCRRCPGLARCLELLDELGDDARDVVLAGEVRDSRGQVVAPRWSLRDAVDDAEGGRGVRITEAGGLGHRRVGLVHNVSDSPRGGFSGEMASDQARHSDVRRRDLHDG